MRISAPLPRVGHDLGYRAGKAVGFGWGVVVGGAAMLAALLLAGCCSSPGHPVYRRPASCEGSPRRAETVGPNPGTTTAARCGEPGDSSRPAGDCNLLRPSCTAQAAPPVPSMEEEDCSDGHCGLPPACPGRESPAVFAPPAWEPNGPVREARPVDVDAVAPSNAPAPAPVECGKRESDREWVDLVALLAVIVLGAFTVFLNRQFLSRP